MAKITAGGKSIMAYGNSIQTSVSFVNVLSKDRQTIQSLSLTHSLTHTQTHTQYSISHFFSHTHRHTLTDSELQFHSHPDPSSKLHPPDVAHSSTVPAHP